MLVEEKTDQYRKTKSRYCTGRLAESFLDLGSMPLANSFLEGSAAGEKEFTCPLSLTGCPTCGLVQLTHVVPPELMFSNYLYVSSTTETFRRHFAEYAKRAKSHLLKEGPPWLAVDMGSNDGLLLACYQKEGLTAVGVEPASNLSREANERGQTTINDYFSVRTVQKILKDFGPADIVSGNNVFAHIDDIHDVLWNVTNLLDGKGLFVIEFPYLVTMVEELLFDMIYHEHLSYIAAGPLQAVLARFGLEIFEIEKVPTHGGSLRVFIQKKGGGRTPSPVVLALIEEESRKGYGSIALYREFAKRVYAVRGELVDFVGNMKTQGTSLSGYGAPAKANTLINFCGLTSKQIDYIVDDNPLKQNMLTPGARIPVVSGKHLFEKPTDVVIIFAWNFALEIVKKLEPLKQKGVRFITPLPKPRFL